MGQVKITTYNDRGVAHITIKPTRCHECRKIITATKGEQMFRKFGLSPFRKWNKFRENNGGL